MTTIAAPVNPIRKFDTIVVSVEHSYHAVNLKKTTYVEWYVATAMRCTRNGAVVEWSSGADGRAGLIWAVDRSMTIHFIEPGRRKILRHISPGPYASADDLRAAIAKAEGREG